MYLKASDIEATIRAIDQEIKLCLVSLASIVAVVVMALGVTA